MSMRAQQARSSDGVTLVELLVVLVLLAVIGSLIGTSVTRGLRADAQARSRIEALEDMQLAMERMSREIRAADPLRVADDHEVEVQVRRQDSCRRFTYLYDPADRELTATEERLESDCETVTGSFGPQVLLRDVDASFSYWGNDRHEEEGTPLAPADPQDVAYVQISLQHELPLEQRPVNVSTVVGLRNH